MVTHRWWGIKFCKRVCKDAYVRELALGRDKIRRQYGCPPRWVVEQSGSMQTNEDQNEG